MSHINGNHQFEQLSDADINLLYDVVLLASQKPGPPFGPGLFAAWDEVIARENVGPEESGRYFAFVCRMVAGRKEGQSVYDRFEGMLRESGIEVAQVEEAQSTQRSEEQTQTGEVGRSNGNGGGDFSEGEEGQSRVNGVQNHNEETFDERNGESHPPVATANGIPSALLQPPKRWNGNTTKRSRSQDTFTKPLPVPVVDHRGRLKTRASSDNLPFRSKRVASTSTNHSIRITRGQEPIYGTNDAYSADESENFSVTHSRRHSFVGSVNPAHDAYIFLPPGLFQRSDEEMEEDVEAFQHSKALIAQRRILWQWRHQAVDLKRKHIRMNQTAEDYDHEILLRNAVAQWRLKAFERMQAKETNSYFEDLEERAIRMRDYMLKLKALTHWMVMAGEKKEKTSTARRQILRARYFTAWKGMTVANDQTVRQHVLEKFFAKLQHRVRELERAERQATAFHDRKVTRRVYDLMANAFMDRAAPRWGERRRIRRFFLHWRDITRQTRERDQWVVQMREHKMQRGLLNAWSARSQRLQAMDTDAANFRRRQLVGQALTSWRKKATLEPLAARVAQRVDQRVMNTALSVWNRNTQMSRQATTFQEARITRNAFTNWNDRLRIQYLEIRINARLRAESFYKWMFAFRKTIAARERDATIVSSCLSQWAAKARVRHLALADASRAFAVIQRHIRLRSAMANLASDFQVKKEQEAVAVAFRNNQLLSHTLSALRTRNTTIQEMNEKVVAARFYILTTSSLRSLREATHQHQQIRRREAYAQVRRRTKMSLAREMLRRMQERLAHIRAIERIAVEKEEDRVMRIVVSDFGAWKAKGLLLVQQSRQADTTYQHKLFGSALRKMRDRFAELRALDQSAISFSAGWAAVEAITSLRRLRFRYLQLRHPEQGARDLREMHWQKHVKNMLRYWAARSVALQQGRLKRADRHDRGNSPEDEDYYDDEEDDGNGPPPAEHKERGLDDLTAFETSAWNLGNLDLDFNAYPEGTGEGGDFDIGPAEGLFTSTPLPGYLRTPSKRNTARAKARERLGAIPPLTVSRVQSAIGRVPATAPPRQQTSSAPPAFPSGGRGGITPFERKLREQGYSERRLGARTPGGPSFRSGFGVSIGGAFRERGGLTRTPATGARGMGNVGFVGFEDIAEVSSERSRNE